MKRLVSSVASALLVFVLAGCGQVDMRPGITSCVPSVIGNPRYGNFSIQQNAPGGFVQWGTYPSAAYAGDWYVVSIYVEGKKGAVDVKRQPYAPHGSVNPVDLRPGKVLTIIGKVTRGTKVTLEFILRCRIA